MIGAYFKTGQPSAGESFCGAGVFETFHTAWGHMPLRNVPAFLPPARLLVGEMDGVLRVVHNKTAQLFVLKHIDCKS